MQTKVVLLYFDSTLSNFALHFKVQNVLGMLEPHSRDFLGHQHHTEKLRPKSAQHLKCSVKVKQRYHSGYCSQICSYQIGKELCRTHHLVSMKTMIYKICNLYIGISQRCSLFLRNSKLLLAFILKLSLQIFYSI